MTKKNEDKRIPFSEIAKGLNQGLETADPQRLAGLQRLQRVRTVKDTGLKREEARLKEKLGPDHPRVAALAVKLNANQELKRDVELGISRAETPAVRSDPNSWVLHGHVRNRARTGLANLTIGLYDQKKKWIEELGYACTDNNGYFHLSYESEKPAAAEGVASTRPEASKQATTQGGQAYIHVLDSKGATLYVDERPLEPTPGEVDYREIILDGEAASCAPPPGATKPKPGKRQDPGKGKTGRYLGNTNTLELHDSKNTTARCQIDEIKADHRVEFHSVKEAQKAGYDFCAYCFGKDKSER